MKAALAQEVINIDRIDNDVIVLKNGGLRKVLLVSGISFDLKSEEEKNLILFGYQEFLNSLDFSLQQIVHSRKVDVSGYLRNIILAQKEKKNPFLRQLAAGYHEFIKEFVLKNPIMAKTFFVAVPYDPIAVPQAGRKVIRKALGILGGKKRKTIASFSPAENLRHLSLRVDEVIDGLNKLGLRAVPLTGDELTELLYGFYNPAATGGGLAKLKKEDV